jgi:macrolide transport system ATP-binding/permease protein
MFKRRRNQADLSDEIRSHLQLEADELKSEGFSEEEAYRNARIAFGNVPVAEERFHTRNRILWLDNAARDVRFAIRQLIRNPAFAAAAVFVLALGIGAGTSIFAFVDAALLEPLPYANPTRLMFVNESDPAYPVWPLSYPDFLDWRRLNHSFSSLDVYSDAGYLLRTPSGAEPVQGARVSDGFFRTLGVTPVLGRNFSPDEGRMGGPDVVLLGYGAWVHRFGGRRDVIGRSVDLDNRSFTVIGVLPRTFSFAPSGNAEFWVPLNTLSPHEQSRQFYNFSGIGRLRDGVTMQAAITEMKGIAAGLQNQYSTSGRKEGASVIPLSKLITGDVRPVLLTLLGGSILLLLIACVNTTSLVLVRSESRRREFAVRGALGATPARLLGQFAAEGLLLALVSGAGGIVVAAVIMRLLGFLVPKDMASNMPFLESANLNLHTILFAVSIAFITALLLAATPALRLSHQQGQDALAEGGRGSAGRFWQRLGAHLIVVELAVAVVLLAGAGLLGKSLYRLLHVPLGFDSQHLATLDVTASDQVYKTDAQTAELYRDIVRRVTALPGVTSAGITTTLPVQCNCPVNWIRVPGRAFHGERNDVIERHVGASYLPALKAGLLRGRWFSEADDDSHPGVVIINETLARKNFPGEDPVGQRLEDFDASAKSIREIVGVISDIREGPLDADYWPTEYLPINQTHDRGFSLLVRTSQQPETLLPVLAGTIHQIDLSLGVSDEETMTQQIDATQAAMLHRLSAWLVAGFAVVALVLSVVGLYGVIAYSVSQRTREIGIRMAVGAQRNSIYTLILGQAGKLAGMGLVIGLVCSIGTSILMRGLLFGVQAWDGATLACVAVVLTLASVLAGFFPARHAASVNPTEALRSE